MVNTLNFLSKVIMVKIHKKMVKINMIKMVKLHSKMVIIHSKTILLAEYSLCNHLHRLTCILLQI